MISGWVDRDAEAIVADGAKAGIDPDLSLRIYTTRLLGRDPASRPPSPGQEPVITETGEASEGARPRRTGWWSRRFAGG